MYNNPTHSGWLRALGAGALFCTWGMVACGGGGTDPTGKLGDPEENMLLRGITAEHNSARSAVKPAPTAPMPSLSWSTTIAATAQAWADKCQFKHSNSNYGENIFASSNASSPSAVVADWVSEAADYTYSTNSCAGVCGHYTQVVWAKSLNLGCGVANCTTGSPFGTPSWQLWVCNYDPPGNYIGEKPY